MTAHRIEKATRSEPGDTVTVVAEGLTLLREATRRRAIVEKAIRVLANTDEFWAMPPALDDWFTVGKEIAGIEKRLETLGWRGRPT